MPFRSLYYVFGLLFLLNGIGKSADTTKTKVDSIRIQGNESTKAFIIMSELTFQTGELIDSSQLHYNRDRIYSLGIFNQVQLYFDKTDTTTLVIDVKEAWYIWPIPFAELVDKDWTKVSYGVDLFVKNFRGLNENFRIRGALGYNPGFRFYYDIPYLLRELGIYASFQGQSDLFNNPNEAAAEEAGHNFDVKHQSGSATVGKRLDNFRWASFTVALDHFLYPDWVQLNQKKDFTIPSVSISYRSDTRNLVQFPTEGQLFAAGYTYRGFGFNGFNYGKIAAEYRKYLPLENGFTLKTRGAVQALTGNRYPYHDFVFLGYGEKVRGHFSDQREGSAGIFTSVELHYPWIKDYTIEFNIPVIPKKLQTYQTSLYSYIFVDASNIKRVKSEFTGRETLLGFGAGLAIVVLPYRVSSIELAFNERGKIEFLFQLDVSF